MAQKNVVWSKRMNDITSYKFSRVNICVVLSNMDDHVESLGNPIESRKHFLPPSHFISMPMYDDLTPPENASPGRDMFATSIPPRILPYILVLGNFAASAHSRAIGNFY